MNARRLGSASLQRGYFETCEEDLLVPYSDSARQLFRLYDCIASQAQTAARHAIQGGCAAEDMLQAFWLETQAAAIERCIALLSDQAQSEAEVLKPELHFARAPDFAAFARALKGSP